MRDTLRSVVAGVKRAECEFCSETFWSERAHRRHRRDEHGEELGRIERRRIEDAERSWSLGVPVALVALVVIPTVVVAGLFVATGGLSGGGSSGPGPVGSVHTHGPITVTIDGERVDFSKQRYQLQDRAFHFEGGEGDRWHAHARGVTLKYAMNTLGIDVSRTSVTFNGTTYRESDPGVRVSVTVNGEPVTPSEYVFQDGDAVRIVVEKK